MTEPTNAKLFGKLAKVMGSVRTLEKTGENKFDKYSYVTSDAIAVRIGKALAAEGVAFLPSLVSAETSEYTTKSGGSNFRTVVQMQITFACTDTGATYTILWSGEAIDRSDKSISKAAVSAVKYALLKTFLLAGGDEEDADAESPVVETQAAPTKPKADKVQLDMIEDLGKVVYNGEWEGNQNKLAQWASQGVRTELADLYATEAAKLIKALEKKLQPEAA